VFEGRGAEPVFCRAGDLYLFNHQVWHRGRPNESDRTRYLLQLQYARGDRFAWRTQGAPRTPKLEAMLADASSELTRLMFGPAQYT
jgi:ectoine hydroxylase-related dioxygenase (phytanoyl-CoA dioxygenase family)